MQATPSREKSSKPAIAGFAALSGDEPADMRVRFAGWGLVTPLGLDANSTWTSLLAGHAIRDHAPAALPGQSGRSRVTQLALHAAREAVAHAGWSAAELSEDQTALVVGTSKGPVERWLNPPPLHMPYSPYVMAGRSDSFGLAQIADDLAGDMPLGRGPRLTISAACASGLHALIRAAMLLRSGDARRAVVVATEASLHPLFLGSFKRLGILPRDGVGCRPFDLHRDGFLMSEAAAAVCLDLTPRATSDAEAHGSRTKGIFLAQFSLGADTTHLTGSDPQGQTLRRCLNHVIAGKPVDLIHAHGTGTIINDPIELAAIESAIVPQEIPPSIYSHKGALGHSLGASGLVSVVLNARMHHAALILPNVNTSKPLSTHDVTLSTVPITRAVRSSVAIASGFGGATAVVGLASI